MRLYEPSADEESKARARDARLAHVPGAVERFRDENPFRLGHPDALVIDGDGQPRPIDRGTDHDRAAVRGVLARIADEVRQHLADAPDVDIERRQVIRHGHDEPFRPARDIELAAQARDQGREGRCRSLEDQWIGLEVGHVEHLVDERSQAAAGLVDPADVGPLLLRLELEVKEGFRVAADERQRGAQLVADGGHEPLAQLLEGPRRAEIAQDRRRPGARAGADGAAA